MAALAVSALAVVTSAGVALFAPKFAADRAAELARENRVQQRLADAYLDVLRLTEREGLWLNALVSNWVASAIESEYDPIPRLRAPSPELADQATVGALLAAFGSREVMEAHAQWRSKVGPIIDADETLRWNLQEGGDPEARPSAEDLQPLSRAHKEELLTRKSLAEAVAAELGHR